MVRQQLRFVIILLLVFVYTAGCWNPGPTYPRGDLQIEAKIVNIWKTGGFPVVQIQPAKEKWTAEFKYFHQHELSEVAIGKCVRVWVKQLANGLTLPYLDRDLAPCNKS